MIYPADLPRPVRALARGVALAAVAAPATVVALALAVVAVDRLLAPRGRHALVGVDEWPDPDPYGLTEWRRIDAHLRAAERGAL